MLLLDILREQYGAEPFSQGDATRDHADSIGQTTVNDHLFYLINKGHVRICGRHSRMFEIVQNRSIHERLDDGDPLDLCEIFRR